LKKLLRKRLLVSVANLLLVGGGLLLLIGCGEVEPNNEFTESPATSPQTGEKTATPRNASATPSNEPESTETPFPQVRVIVNAANVRSGPGTNYPKIGQALEGESLSVIAQDELGHWYNVVLSDGKEGWIGSTVVEAVSFSDNVQIAETIPPPEATIAEPAQPPQAINTPQPVATQAPPSANCHPSYPTVCIPPPPPDLDCGDIPYRRFRVLPPDPHGFDRDNDGIGCES